MRILLQINYGGVILLPRVDWVVDVINNGKYKLAMAYNNQTWDLYTL